MFDDQARTAGGPGCTKTDERRFGVVGRWMAARRNERRQRLLLQSVAGLDDRMLADIGMGPLEREDALGRHKAPPIRLCGG